MRRIMFCIALTVALTAVVFQSVRSQPEPPKQAPHPGQKEVKAGPAKDRAADEAAIRANIAEFVKAYNAGDAKAVAALFTPDGQVVSKDGEEAEGREAIAKDFADAFAVKPKRQLEVLVESIRFIGADLALEVGTTKETFAATEPPDIDRYTVLHVKRDGKWQMALAREDEGPTATAHEQLKSLAWLVGEWIDDGGSTVVRSSCRWSEDKNFLLQDFTVQANGRDSMNISQRIGWDPLTKHVRSWTFDSEGGFGESVWTRDGNSWVLKATAVRPDGTTASATNFVTRSGPDAYVWRSTDRIVGDERQAPMEVKVIRKPPQPKK